MDAVAARFSGCVKVRQRSFAIQIDCDSAHEVMLGGHDRDVIFNQIIAFLQAVGMDARKPSGDRSFYVAFQEHPDIGQAVLFHLGVDRFRQQVARQQFISETLAVFADEDGAFPTQ
ncbi:hypothetical protein SDC9_87789 [bioreactor metagenome]|uniref:Uncharacterized protein n=1 Tax=bioreactor metagenome TaxID=1076179 RepID=A0A644ZJW8_9ZZZZ